MHSFKCGKSNYNTVDTLAGGVHWTFGGFEFYVAVWGVRSGPAGLLAALRFKTLDYQPDSSNMGPVWTDVHECCDFQKRSHGFLAWYLSCSRPGCFQIHISGFSVGTKKMRDEKLCRFVVVSPREVPSLPVSRPFKIFDVRSFSRAHPVCPFQFREFSVH